MAGPASVTPPQERKLPPLRKQLQFIRAAPTPEGVPTWTIVDPLRNKYFQIEWPVYQLLQRWSCGTVEKLVAVTRRDTTSRIGAEDVEDLVRFLYANNLTEQSASGQTKDYVEQEAARHHVWWQWLLHHYLFIKIPLVRPHKFLQATLPLVAPGIISGGLFAFATSFDEVVVTLFLASPAQNTLPRQMFTGIRENISPAIAAVATILIVLSTLMLLTLEGLRQRSERLRTGKSR